MRAESAPRAALSLLAGLALGLALAASGCQATTGAIPRAWLHENDAPPKFERRKTLYPNGSLRAQWTVLIPPRGRLVKHGKEQEWYADGTPKAEREFRRGEPTGTWRSWHENGAQRSESSFTDPPQPTATIWWFPDGSLSSAGPAINGLRDGPWELYHPNGELAATGEYVQGEKQGPWSFWNPAGELIERGAFLRGKRQGEWEHGPAWTGKPITE